MRRLAGGARACDVGGCWQAWPCKTHNQHAVGGGLNRAQVAMLAARADYHKLMPPAERRDLVCGDCGYHVCSCAEPWSTWEPAATFEPAAPKTPVTPAFGKVGWAGKVRCVRDSAVLPKFGVVGDVFEAVHRSGVGLELVGRGLFVTLDRFVPVDE